MVIRDRHVVISGANGFVGQHLSRHLKALGVRTTKLSRPSGNGSVSDRDTFAVDLAERRKVMEIISSLKPDYLIHLASNKSRENDEANFRIIYDSNVEISLNLIEACQLFPDFRRFIFIGTCDEYGMASTPYRETAKERPTTVYGLSKLAVTNILNSLATSHGFPSVVLRPSVIYGPGQGKEMFLPALIESLIDGIDFSMTLGEQRRDFIYIADVVDAIVKAICVDERIDGQVINIGSGASIQVKEVAAMVATQIGVRTIDYIKFGGVPYRSNESMEYSLEINRAKEFLDWMPSTSISHGIREMIAYSRAATK